MKLFKGLLLYSALVASSLVFPPATTVADVTEHAENVHRKGNLITYRMKVTPAAESVPAFKHRLTVVPYETVAGNAAMLYANSFAESGLRRPSEQLTEKFGFDLYRWSSPEVADADVPLEKLREVCEAFDRYIEDSIHRATLCRDCDWGFEEESMTGLKLIEFPLSSVQQSRGIARVLALRTRLAILEGRYDDAIEHLRMNYRLAQNVGEVKFLVGGLVALAEFSVANQGTLQLMAAKDSPNMYWGLAELPSPPVNMRDAIRLESHWGLRMFPELIDIEDAEFSEEEWARQLKEVYQKMGRLRPILSSGSRQSERDIFEEWGFAAIALNSYPSAKNRLLQSGWEAAKVDAMPVGQVLMIDMKNEYLRIAQEGEKRLYLPAHQRNELGDFEESLKQNIIDQLSMGRLLADMLLPATNMVQQAQLRVECQRRALQVIEALRMHAAATGSFPASLDEITAVPVPLNPVTNQSFVYQLNDGQAVVEIPFSDGFVGLAYRYEIELAN